MWAFLRSLFATTAKAAPVVAKAVPVARKAGPAGAVLLAAAIFIAPWEGLRTSAYIDPVGVPTICYGHIEGVKIGMKMTAEECKLLLAEDLPKYWEPIKKCVPNLEKLPRGTQEASLSLAYNIGTGGFCKSSIASNLRAGNVRAACDRFLLYDKATDRRTGQRVTLKGLTNRRQAERKLCLKGL